MSYKIPTIGKRLEALSNSQRQELGALQSMAWDQGEILGKYAGKNSHNVKWMFGSMTREITEI